MKKKTETINDLETNLSYEIDFEEVPPEDIIAYNELRSAADLSRMYDEKILEIQPDFQRDFIWKDPDQTRFIDSLMKQLPIPSMCLSLDYKTQKWKVIDGLQRLSTIIRFLTENEWSLSNLKDVDKKIAGKKIREIKKHYPTLYSRVQNITLPINILRCDYSKKNHSEYMFMVFHRLNTGGVKLNNQEIRNAIYQGPFSDFLKECNRNQRWRTIIGLKDERSDRSRKIELILRFFAFLDIYKDYTGRLASFLNDYMFGKRYKEEEIPSKKEIFESTINIIYEKVKTKKEFLKMSNVAMEALMFGVANNIENLQRKDADTFGKYVKKLFASKPFLEQNIREGIQKKDKVMERLNVSKKIFSGK